MTSTSKQHVLLSQSQDLNRGFVKLGRFLTLAAILDQMTGYSTLILKDPQTPMIAGGYAGAISNHMYRY